MLGQNFDLRYCGKRRNSKWEELLHRAAAGYVLPLKGDDMGFEETLQKEQSFLCSNLSVECLKF